MTSYDPGSVALPRADVEAATSFLTRVYMWMFLGLFATAFAAWATLSTPSLLRAVAGSQGLFFGLIIGELILVLVISWGINRISAFAASALFVVYSLVNGVTLSLVFLAYTESSVFKAFISSACMFAGMSVYGYFTKRDLTTIGSYLYMGLWGLVIAMLVNLFFRSPAADYVISIIGVGVFLGLTAYDTQKILRMGDAMRRQTADVVQKSTIIGALALYLDFINLFLYLLRLFGKRR